jgi:hypothetical protein
MQIATDKNMGSVADFAEQDSFFEKYDPVAIEIAKKLEGTQKSFAAFMQTMNGGLKYAANGEADIFLGGVESREDILARMLNMKKAMGGAIDAAINGALRFFHGLSKGRGSFEREKVILNRAGENIETYRRVAKQAEALPPSDEQVISPDRKKTVAVDFDGVINSYKSGWKGPAETDELVIGAAHALRELFELGHKIIVFSTRANTPEGEETIRDYIMEVTETPEIYNSIEVTDRKPVADVYIDDRAIPFTGDWKETLEQIKNFEPWTKREKSAQISEDEANITQISDDLIDAAGYLHDSENDAKQKLGEVVEAVHALAVAPEEDESKKENKYVFLGLGENGLTLKFSDDINSFEIWNHYGFIPQPEHFEKLEKDGVVGWTGNDTWYYIMQHDTWRYMNLDLSAKIDKSIVEKSLTWSGYPLQGRTKVQGMDISIENKKGSTRSGTDKDGHEWHTEMHFDYGYIRGTVGTDKDHLDAYVGPNPESEIVYIVNQNDPVTGDFDEQKVMLGFNSEAEAKEAYLKQYDRPGFLGSIVKMDIDTFKEKAFDIKNRGKPLKKAVA